MMDWLQKLKDMIPSRRITIDNTTNPEWAGYEEYHKQQRPSLEDLGEYSVSAYNPQPGQTDETPWLAARNFDLRPGSQQGVKYAAVARKALDDPTPMIPYGTKVRVNNDEYEVRDMMNARYAGQKNMDLFIPDDSEEGNQRARSFGRQNLRIYK